MTVMRRCLSIKVSARTYEPKKSSLECRGGFRVRLATCVHAASRALGSSRFKPNNVQASTKIISSFTSAMTPSGSGIAFCQSKVRNASLQESKRC